MRWIFGILLCLVILIRLPSLVEPAGGDQGLYAYVAKTIAHGGMPYRDAWDQKPPAVHYTYALMFGAWSNEGVVAAADLVAAALIAFVLFRLGRRFAAGTRAGEIAALLFLLLANPALGRMGGIWVRGQCETFIALLVSAALLVLAPRSSTGSGDPRASAATLDRPRLRCLLGGGLLGLAVVYKYNAALYLVAAAATLAFWPPEETWRRRPGPPAFIVRLALLSAGALVPVALTGLAFWAGGALTDLWQATVVYNLQYSGETYPGAPQAVWYVLSFPVKHAGVDGLWFVGGIGSATLIVLALSAAANLIVPAWVAAACLAIAANGARDLPQYFIQASPLLALAAGLAAVRAWRSLGVAGRLIVFGLIAVGVVRVAEFDKLAENVAFDARYMAGRMSRTDYLARFGGQRPTDKFSALAVTELGEYLGANTEPGDRVFVFGFSGAAYVRADRLSASRFFWSRPIIAGFNEGRPGYGSAGLLQELQAREPKVVVLQQHDWPAERIDSAGYFLGDRSLALWLRSNYRLERDTGTFLIWARKREPGLPMVG